MGPLSMHRPSMAVATATVIRDADTLVFRGALARAAVAALWRQVQPLRIGIGRLDLTAVSVVDSAGLALLAELAHENRAGDSVAGDGIVVVGAPAGLAELRAAYRLDERLAFAS